jgi:hypothetical protein
MTVPFSIVHSRESRATGVLRLIPLKTQRGAVLPPRLLCLRPSTFCYLSERALEAEILMPLSVGQ